MNEKKANEAKEYLEQIQLCDKRINCKLEELSRLNALAFKVTSSLKQVAVFGGGTQDKVGDAVSKIVDLQKEINDDIDKYCDKKAEVRELIDQLKNPDELEVLSRRYLLYESLEKIACEMGFTYRNVCYIHGKALQTVAELMGIKPKETVVWERMWETTYSEEDGYEDYVEGYKCSKCGYEVEVMATMCPGCNTKMKGDAGE